MAGAVIRAVAWLGPREVERSLDAVLLILSKEDLSELSAAWAVRPAPDGRTAKPSSCRRITRRTRPSPAGERHGALPVVTPARRSVRSSQLGVCLA
jgi:hypothetical protein